MALHDRYRAQVRLLLRLVPFIDSEPCFALKGGTAINLFVRELPRLSVDLDLVYLPMTSRDEALSDIHSSLGRIADAVGEKLGNVHVTRSWKNKEDALRLVVQEGTAQVKIELSPVLRSTVCEPERREVSSHVEDEFGYAEALVLSFPELYAGKICAALDRQHPRDLFDMWLLLKNEGITSDIRKLFLVYLVSHKRPAEELLFPTHRPLDDLFRGEFQGMTRETISLEEIESARSEMLRKIQSSLEEDEKHFLVSFHRNRPEWERLGLSGIENLPAIRWKLHNIGRMPESKMREAASRLEERLW